LAQLLYSLNDKDNLILDDDGFIIIDYKENDVVYTENAEFSDNTDTENDVDNVDAVENTNEVVENTKDIVENTEEVDTEVKFNILDKKNN
jgi:hypothetical protein